MEAANTLQNVGACCGGTVVPVALLAVALALLYWYSIAPFSQLDRLGIRHPKPMPFLGNLPFFKQGFWEGDRALVKAYGPICGYYMGRRMMIVVADPDAIKQILQDDFSIFQNRTASSLLPKMMRHSLLFLRDERWKQIRSTLMPTFSSATLSEICPLINQACDVLVGNLKSCADSGEICDLHRYYRGLTMDIVASMMFGRIIDSEQNPDEPLIKQVAMFLDLFTPAKPTLILAVAFPSLMSFFLRLLPNKKQEEVNGFFGPLVRDLVAGRDQQVEKERRRDLLQLVLNTRGTSHSIPVEHFDIVNQADLTALQRGASPEKTQTSMNPDEILGQAMVFILAGYETTRSLLSFTSYLLAINPECQEKLLREVDTLTDIKTPPDHATVQRLPYLDMVISEALRMYPPAFRFAREASKDCTVAGLYIPAGAVVEIPVGCIQNNPEYWPEPEKFKPERFTAEAKKTHHPFVYLPFGAGPRCCIGVRLALLQTKVTLVRVLQNYRLESCPQTQVPLQLNTLAIVGPKDGMHVRIVPR